MRLSAEELTQLEIAHRKTRSKKEGDRIKCIIAWGKGYSWDLIKEILLISDGTIKNYVDAYQNGGLEELLKTNHDGNHFKLTKEQEQALAQYVESYNILCSKQVCQYVKRKFGVRFSVNGMTLLLKRLGFSYKKPKLRPEKVNTRSHLSFVWNYYLKMATITENEALYFLDASGFVHNARLDYGWIKKGTAKQIKGKSGRQKLNVNGAFNPETLDIITVTDQGNMNSESNIALIEKIIKKNPEKTRLTLILDNARMNHSKALKEFIEKQTVEIELWHLPVYSPHLNLIERLWRFSKRKLLSNKYYSSFIKFKEDLNYFFEEKVHRMRKELKTLMTPHFQKF